MNFTQDWFSNNIPNFETCMSFLHDRKLFLEIGSFEGKATCWMLKNGLAEKGSIVCIDPYEKLDFDPTINMSAVEARFWTNTQEARKSTQVVSLVREPSYKALAEMIGFKYAFDFVYVDGSHAPDIALTDACMAWGLLKPQGIMLFDDYQYPHEPTKIGIDGFLNAFKGQYRTIVNNYQMGIQKL